MAGSDEKNLSTCFQDVDFCLKLVEKGYRIVYTPYARLLHYESATKSSIAEGYEIEYMHKRWSRLIADDPYYNPNLSRRREDYSLNFEGPSCSRGAQALACAGAACRCQSNIKSQMGKP